MVGKLLVLLILGRAFRMGFDQNLLFAFALAQGGEFAFVLLSFATQQGILAAELTGLLVAVVAVSMALTPLVLLVNERLIQPRVGTRARPDRQPDEVSGEGAVIIAGFGRLGNIVGRLLRANGVRATVLDLDSDQVELLRRLGHKVYYGDASRLDLLRAAGAERARVLVVAVDEPDKVLEIVATVRRHFPHLIVMARAFGRTEAYDLLDAGVERVYRETLDSALRVGEDVLRELGYRAHDAHRRMRAFRRLDERMLHEMREHRHDQATYVREVRRRVDALESLLEVGGSEQDVDRDSAWDSESLRREYGGSVEP